MLAYIGSFRNLWNEIEAPTSQLDFRLLSSLEMKRCTSFYVATHLGKFLFHAPVALDDDRSPNPILSHYVLSY